MTPAPHVAAKRHVPVSIDRFILLPVAFTLLVLWAAVFAILAEQRRDVLARAHVHLISVAKSISNAEALLEHTVGLSDDQKNAVRFDAINDALLRNTSVHIWIEAGGATIAGARPAGDPKQFMVVDEKLEMASVYAAQSIDDILAGWHRGLWRSFAILGMITITVATISGFLVLARRQRTSAELRLGNRDAILHAVTESATKLLNAEDLGTAIIDTLASFGAVLNVNRIYATTVTITPERRILFSVVHEWHAPDLAPLKNNPMFTNCDVTDYRRSEEFESARAGTEQQFFMRDLAGVLRTMVEQSQQQAVLSITMPSDGTDYGDLVFSDASPARLRWTITEIDTLRTLTGLVGAALARARHTEEQKKTQTEMLLRDRALENINQGITIVEGNSPDSPIIYTNPAFADLTGYTREEIVGRDPATLFFDSGAAARIEGSMTTAHGDKRTRRLEVSMRRKDGTRFLNSTKSSTIRDGNGEVSHIVTIHEDITELRRREEVLMDAQRLESVGQLTGGIAHDFNNLLTAIKSNAEDLRDDLKENALLQSQAEIVLEAADRGADLVAQMMAFARKQELQPQTVDVNVLVENFVKLLRRTLPANIDIKTVMGLSLPSVHVDPNRLENALLNLAFNARDAMPGGGSITIETMESVLDADYTPDHVDVKQGSYVLIAVTDTGSGMSQEILERAFVPFFTTKEVGKGTGLGLSMVYGFVRQSGGHAQIHSEVGHGTVVKIYLPAQAQGAGEPDRGLG